MSTPKGLEFYETPQAFSRYLFRTVPIAGRLFEPCVGTGAIIRAHGEASDWRTNDLDERHAAADTHYDATQRACWEAAGPIDFTISNPAFTPAIAIIEHALEYSRIGVAMHLRASIHEVLKTGPRRSFMRRHTPTGILWLPRFAYQRSPTTGEWATDSVCACWVVWVKDRTRPQFIDYAPEWVLEALDRETPDYRARMDALAALRQAPPAEVLA